uniref:Transmembrane protein 249 n=1 Tax=Terrapene triunguis TaxID=2587831 RepID=A0A674JRR7_9SAUR
TPKGRACHVLLLYARPCGSGDRVVLLLACPGHSLYRPPVFVMEYYKDTLWKGALIFLVSFPSPPPRVSQDYSGFFVYGILVGFWLLLSSMHKRHLVINHARGCYQIYIKRRLWEEGPLHQIYVRLVAQTDAYGKRFYSLIINGHGLEVLALASLSDNYEHMEFLGRRIARKLKLNYFDYLDVSTRHVIRHRPPLDPGAHPDPSPTLLPSLTPPSPTAPP